MRILITGCAGFIGFHVCFSLIKQKKNIVYGIDNLNDYYDINLKKERLGKLRAFKNFNFKKINICNSKKVLKNFQNIKYDIVIHLAAQAGIRYSIENPDTYINNNLLGFYSVINAARIINVKHFIFASSSSVYGENKKFPLKEDFKTDMPLSLYAATKKSNELIAYSYANIFKIPVTGLRFFTVYGPFGRPDMAIYKFTKSLIDKETIYLFNKGNNYRDFTYIDDVVKVIKKLLKSQSKQPIPYSVYNIGSGKPIKTLKLLNIISKNLKIKPIIQYLNSQKGDVVKTHANLNLIKSKFPFKAKTNIETGIRKFISWYKNQSN